MNYEVYISYSKKDSEIAMQVCEAIESNDVKCCIASRDIDMKKDPIEQVANAIQSAENVVLIYSKNALESQDVLNEISFALSNKINVIPVNVDGSSEEPDLYIGANKPKANFQGTAHNFKLEIPSLNVNETFNNDSALQYIYLSYDNADLDFVNAQINQYESQKINFRHGDDSQIEDSALLVYFMSKNSCKSKKIRNDVITAISNHVDIFSIHLDDAKPDFGTLFRLAHASKFKKAVKFDIYKNRMDELTYIEKCDEIFQLYNVKKPQFSLKNLEYLLNDRDEVTLTEDIIIKEEISASGIDLKRENLIIDGGGHSISVKSAENIFNIKSENVTIKNLNFKDCRIDDGSSIISVDNDAYLILKACKFQSCEGQIISSLGDIEIWESKFQENSSLTSPILSKGHLMIKNTEFKSNRSQNNGGAIQNEGESHISNTRFTENACNNNGGAIYNKNSLFLENNDFSSNTAVNEGSSIYNESEIICHDSRFSNHNVSSSMILNENMIELGGCLFEKNQTHVTIENRNDAILSIIRCEFIYNKVNRANIYNSGRCTASDIVFESNTVDCRNSFEIYNEGNLTLKNVKLDENHIFSKKIITGIDKPLEEPEGIVKPNEPIVGQEHSNPYVYLSFDNQDLDFINSQINQYKSLKVNFKKDNPSEIFNSALIAVFVSKKSYDSLKIEHEINNAHSSNVPILTVYLDDVESEFKQLNPTFEDKFTIDKYELSELEYISKYSEIFQLYGVKIKAAQDEMPKSADNHEISPSGGFSFTDLENLIQHNSKITLTDDVYLLKTESSQYENGIDLNREDLIIQGNGHSIFANDINRIFNIKSKNIKFKNLNFNKCSMNDESAMIYVSEDSSLILDNCTFQSNDLDDGHVIFTRGDIDVIGSKFEDNHSKNEGTAIYSRNGKLNIIGCEFIDNESQNSGGAILNWARLNVRDSKFINNHAEGYGGAIGNVIDAVLNINSTEFRQNEAVGEASAIYNENRASCVSCNFIENNSKLSLIFNENKFDMVNCNFKNNTSRIIFQNHENGISYLSNSKFIENKVMITNVYNNGESFSLEKVEFKNNKAAIVQAVNIYNETYMRLKEPILDDNTILNKEHMDIWKYDPKLINNSGTIAVMDEPCDKEFSFYWLEKKINQSKDKIIRLENNIRLENCELDFYEGGMEISRNNVTIDGNGHYIDGAKRTAIFHITGKNVTLKNIRFKNANLINDFYDHTTGGSAIRTITSSSLNIENCEFVDNVCDDDGGAILNNSELEVSDCLFENNTSRAYGGAICNKNTLILKNNEFKNNISRTSQDIFNSRKIFGIFNSENVFDVGDEYHESESFSHLTSIISKSSEIILNCDIKFDYRHDQNLKDGIEITDIESLTIEGNGFSIDGDDRAGLFNLKNSNVVFKNITFKNAITQDSSIFENDARTTFINCRFINNHPSYDTSLINNNGQVKLENCRFINNLSKNKSLISNDNEFEIKNCEFSLNSNEKSTIANSGHLSIENSKFINNHSEENAGALRNEKKAKLLVKNTIFKSNSTSASGGAVLNFGDLLFSGCLFESNFAYGDGGIINNEKDANLEIEYSDISSNSSKGDGGAVINWGNLSFKNSIFSKNTARKDGGVVNIQKGTISIEDCEFNKNSAFDGGSIFNRGNLKIENSKFEENTAKKDGGALNTYDGNINIHKSLFIKNNADDGGAIYSREGEILIWGSEFFQNSGSINGGAIITWCEMTIENSRLAENTAKIYGGAINNQKNLLSLKNCEFSKNNADTGGAIFNIKEDNLKTIDCEFRDNSPDDL